MVLAAVLLVPVAGSSTSPRAGAAVPDVAHPSAATSVSVSWDGKNISSAGSPSSAFTIAPGQTATVLFTYRLLGGGNGIVNASLKLTYFGVVLSTTTSQTHPSVVGGGTGPAGAAIINWSFGSYYQFVEGAFQLTAGLLNANGSSVWSQTFYVDAKAAYSLESILVVVLLLVGALEIYYLATDLRAARRAGRNVPEPLKEAPPVVPPASETSPPGSGPPGGGGSP